MNNIKVLRKARGLTLKELGALCDISESAMQRIESGARKPSFEVLLKLTEALECTSEEILGAKAVSVPSTRNKSVFETKYEALDEHGKTVVNAILDLEYNRCVMPVKKPAKVIPLFPAAAGRGEPVDGEPFEEYEVPADSGADFAVRISGDSMEPHFTHGQIVLCKRRAPQTGDIAVMMLNGTILVKQFIPGYDGQYYLRSLNRARSNLDYDFIPSGNDTLQAYGVVIHKRIPLVEQ